MAKFPWGAQAFVLPALFAGMLLGIVVIGTILVVAGPDGQTNDAFPSAKDLHGMGLAMAAWALMWYSLLGNQVGTSFADGYSHELKTKARHIADRGVINTMEQSLPFLILIWAHALLVNPRTSVPLAFTFVICRVVYAFLYGLWGQMNSMVELPSWICLVDNFYLMFAVICKCAWGTDLHANATAISPAMVFVWTSLAGIGTLFMFIVPAKPVVAVILRGVEWDAEYDAASQHLTGLLISDSDQKAVLLLA